MIFLHLFIGNGSCQPLTAVFCFYCNEESDLGVFRHVQDANTAVIQEIRERIRSVSPVKRLNPDCDGMFWLLALVSVNNSLLSIFPFLCFSGDGQRCGNVPRAFRLWHLDSLFSEAVPSCSSLIFDSSGSVGCVHRGVIQ